MCRKVYLALVVAMIGGTILSMTEVDAQSTVDDSASCESSTLDEAVDLIREELKDMKNLLGANRQQNNASSISKKNFEDLKAAFNALTQQQNNASSISKKDFEDLKAAVDALTQQQNNMSNIFKKELENMSNTFKKELEVLKAACVSNSST